MRKETLGFIAVFLGNFIFGFSFLFSKIALDITIPSVLIAVRFTVAFLVLNVVVLIGSLIKRSDGKSLISFSLKGKPKKDLIILALFQPIIYFICENYGMVYTSSSFAGIIIGTIPIFGLIFDLIFFKSKLSIKQIICSILAFGGVLLISFASSDIKSSFIGTILLLLAAISSSLFYIFSKRTANTYNSFERTYVMFGIGAIFFIILASIQASSDFNHLVVDTIKTPMFWVSISYLAIVSSVIAFILLNFGSGNTTVSKATIMANITSVVSIIAGVIFLNETFTWLQVIGMIVIVLSVFVATVTKKTGKIIE